MSIVETRKNALEESLMDLDLTESSIRDIKLFKKDKNVGILLFENSLTLEKKKIVLKSDKVIDYRTNHEASVLKKLNSLNSIHFVMFYKSTSKGILMEYLENGSSFYDLVKNGITKLNKKLFLSNILQTLLTLEISQKVLKFVNYDLHLNNIFRRKCEEDSVILNLYPELDIITLLPTFGEYPTIIDTAMSHIESDDMFANSLFDMYHYGRQSVIFDPLNDVHHLFFSIFKYIKLDTSLKSMVLLKKKITNLFNSTDSIFGISEEYGDKKLKGNIMGKLLSDLGDKIPTFFKDRHAFLNVLNGLVSISSFDEGKRFTPKMESVFNFIKNLTKLIDTPKVVADANNIENVLKKIKQIILILRGDLEISTLELKKEELEKYVDIIKLLVPDVKNVSDYLTLIVINCIQENNLLIDEMYKKCYDNKLYSPIDFFNMICRNFTPSVKLTKSTIIYVSTRDGIRVHPSLTQDSIDKINKTPFSSKGKVMSSIIMERS